MRKLLLLLFWLALSFSSNAQYLWQIYADKIVKWNYYDGDEFNKGKIDYEKWITNQPWGKPVFSQEIIYEPENVTFNQGKAQFLIKKENKLFQLESWEFDTIYLRKNRISLIDQNKINFKYSGGLLWTKRKYRFGYFEIKFRAPDGQGIWPAFWLYGANPNNEIDFFELKGEEEKSMHLDIHCPDGCGNYIDTWYGYKRGWGHWVRTDKKLKDGYNVVSGEWTKDYVKWYLNGRLIAYSNHSFDLDMWLTAGTGIAKDGGPFKPGPNDKTPFPNYFNVDYIRVYKTDTLPNFPILKKNLAETTDTLATDNDNLFKANKSNKKLQHNPDKKVKGEKVITLSVMQLTKTNFSLRVLGAGENDTFDISVFNEKGQPIKKIRITGNKEIIFSSGNEKKIALNAEINKQVINEVINVQ